MTTTTPNLAQALGQANSKRSAARLAAVQALYQMDVAGTDISDVLEEFQSDYFSGAETGGEDAPASPASETAAKSASAIGLDQKSDESTDEAPVREALFDLGYFEDILTGILKSQSELDPLIDQHLRSGWRLNRIDSTLRAILRAGTYELKSHKKLSVGLIIDEYLHIAHAFFEGDEPKVVNAVLDKVGKSLRPKASNEKKAD